ncbi:hypothetical protein TL18_01195 [Methanobrevibacter sp. YE315]|uniref:hypothetical protein n=1 Tax=Methanobrevibacter sp. YE315 TaxID=1609968 RepID=UPI000764EABB|nr:hypothetical protein [Methanobrevibacter sp. YE315]AMD16775.1 hypothetical protein TL18_01195 [Methanobrevibacter sp. YE315]
MENDALVNGVLSFILPGLGQAINGYKKRAIIFFIVMLVIHALIYYFANNIFGSAISTLYHLYAGYDAYKTY